jgi:hypothetical protein
VLKQRVFARIGNEKPQMRLDEAGGAFRRNLIRLVFFFLPALLHESVVQIPHWEAIVVCISFSFYLAPFECSHSPSPSE